MLPLLTAALIAAPHNHLDAPFKTEAGTLRDLYAFNSYETNRDGFVTLIATMDRRDSRSGNPTSFLKDDTFYEINIDHDGDALRDITFRFDPFTNIRDIPILVDGVPIDISLPSSGPITTPNSPNNAAGEFYTAGVYFAGDDDVLFPLNESGTNRTRFRKPIDNLGTATHPNYFDYWEDLVYDVDLPGGFQGRMFVGGRKDPVSQNLGMLYDLGGTLLTQFSNVDEHLNTNVTALCLEVPNAFLTGGAGGVIGVWATSHTRNPCPPDRTRVWPPEDDHEFEQISRIGHPLVREAFIGNSDKETFDASGIVDDLLFMKYFTNPSLPELIQMRFSGGYTAPDQFPRQDLVEIYLTGVPGLNDDGSFGEMMRLNTDILPTDPFNQDRLGFLGGDLAGYPNGRRPGDDTVDVAVRATMGVLLDPSVAPSGQLPYSDGVNVTVFDFDFGFPYLREPLPRRR